MPTTPASPSPKQQLNTHKLTGVLQWGKRGPFTFPPLTKGNVNQWLKGVGTAPRDSSWVYWVLIKPLLDAKIPVEFLCLSDKFSTEDFDQTNKLKQQQTLSSALAKKIVPTYPVVVSKKTLKTFTDDTCGEIWALLHLRTESNGSITPPYKFDPKKLSKAWAPYKEVNQAFVTNFIELVKNKKTRAHVINKLHLINDYQLLLAPRMARTAIKTLNKEISASNEGKTPSEREPLIKIPPFHFFLHIPFPSPEAIQSEIDELSTTEDKINFKAVIEEILHSMLGANSLAFHIKKYRKNFLAVLQEFAPKLLSKPVNTGKLNETSDDRIQLTLRAGRKIIVDVNPIGTNCEAYASPESHKSLDEADKKNAQKEQAFVNKEMINFKGSAGKRLIGISRCDTTKNKHNALLAYQRYYRENSPTKNTLEKLSSFVMVAVPNRTGQAPYVLEGLKIMRTTLEINLEFGWLEDSAPKAKTVFKQALEMLNLEDFMRDFDWIARKDTLKKIYPIEINSTLNQITSMLLEMNDSHCFCKFVATKFSILHDSIKKKTPETQHTNLQIFIHQLEESIYSTVDQRLKAHWKWKPVHCVRQGIKHAENMVRFYQQSGFKGPLAFCVSSLIDGFNLVCEEFVIANQNRKAPTSLILSTGAGAAEFLTPAILVDPVMLDPENPTGKCIPNIPGFMKAFKQFISPASDEVDNNFQKLVDIVKKHGAVQWSMRNIETMLIAINSNLGTIASASGFFRNTTPTATETAQDSEENPSASDPETGSCTTSPKKKNNNSL